MSTHRVCCCGEVDGACGYIARAFICDGGQAVQQAAFISGRAIRHSGASNSYREVRDFTGAFVTEVLWDFNESGVAGVGVQWGRPPTEQEVVTDLGLASFQTQFFQPATRVGTSELYVLPAAAYSQSGQLRPGAGGARQLIGGGTGTITPDFNVNFNPGCGTTTSGTQTTVRSMTGSPISRQASIVQTNSNPLASPRYFEERWSVNIVRDRSVFDLPSNWEGPPGFDLCAALAGVSGALLPNPNPAPSTAPGNDAMIEAMLAADPLRNCRTCGP